MDLLDRYLQAVKKHLPWQRQDDIVAELRANLESQLEDKEAALGRPLTMGEAEDWLRQIGPPIKVAARYQPQQYLIGPAVFPTYWFVLQMACFWVLVIYSIVSALQIAVHDPSGASVLAAVLRLPGVLMTTAAWVTLIFAAIEFAATHYPGKWGAIAGATADWSPSALPPVEKDAVLGKKPRSLAQAVAEVIFGFLFLVWLLLIPENPFLLLGPGAYYLPVSPFQLAPIWVQFFWWVVAINVLQLGWHCAALIRGSWRKPRNAETIVMSAVGLIPLALLLSIRDNAFVLLKHPAQDLARYGGTLHDLNKGIHLCVVLVFTIVVMQLVWQIGRMSLDVYRKRTAAMR
jgi:hypothetical protein